MLEGLLAYVVTTFGRPMIMMGVLFLGFLFVTGRVGLGTVALVAVGGIIISQYQAIAGLIGF
jgi:hypothetical protein